MCAAAEVAAGKLMSPTSFMTTITFAGEACENWSKVRCAPVFPFAKVKALGFQRLTRQLEARPVAGDAASLSASWT